MAKSVDVDKGRLHWTDFRYRRPDSGRILAYDPSSRPLDCRPSAAPVIPPAHRPGSARAGAWFALAILRRDLGKTQQAHQALTEAAQLVGWDHPEILKFLSRSDVLTP